MKGDLLHIRVGKAMKDQMKKLLDSGLFSTEAEIAREGIRGLLLKYLKESGIEKDSSKQPKENYGKKE